MWFEATDWIGNFTGVCPYLALPFVAICRRPRTKVLQFFQGQVFFLKRANGANVGNFLPSPLTHKKHFLVFVVNQSSFNIPSSVPRLSFCCSTPPPNTSQHHRNTHTHTGTYNHHPQTIFTFIFYHLRLARKSKRIPYVFYSSTNPPAKNYNLGKCNKIIIPIKKKTLPAIAVVKSDVY